MLRRVLVTVLLMVPAISEAQRGEVSGVAFVDANGSGVRDGGERGLARVVVSNQEAVVATDASGVYRLPPGANGVLFVSVPDGTFIHASDTHIAPAALARTQRFRALADSLDPAFVIVTGDLVKDALRVGETEARGYYDLFRREVTLFKSPVWTVPGNHEIFGVERGRSNVSTTHPLYGRKMYHHYQGPDYYSFNHIPFFSSFEGLGGYDDKSPAPTLITVNGKTAFRHTVSNAGAALAVLRKHRHVLALGGHVHAGEQIVYEVDGLKTRFNQTPAIVGPNAGAGMRFVSGFTLYTVRDGVIDAGRFIPLGIDKER